MRLSLPLVVLALTLSACAGTAGAGGPNGWAAGRPKAKPAVAASDTRRPVPVRQRPVRLPRRVEAPPVETASGLMIPVAGIRGDQLRDTFEDARSGGRTHHAIDIAAPTGTPIVAVTGGTVTRMNWNRLGGRTLYLTSADGRYDFYYAHLDSYADGLGVGARVERGQALGTVGATGNARGAHLHFQVLDKRGGGRGVPVNPYDLLRAADWVLAD